MLQNRTGEMASANNAMNLSIDVLSDLHADSWDKDQSVFLSLIQKWYNSPFHQRKSSHILVIAGDISQDLNITLRCLRSFAQIYEHILIVPGNHDLEAVAFHYEKYQKRSEYIQSQIPQVHDLSLKPFIERGMAFIGCFGGFDHYFDTERHPYPVFDKTKNPPQKLTPSYDTKKDKVPEGREKRWQTHEFQQLIAALEIKRLERQFQKIQANPDVHTVAVVTHTMPHKAIADIIDNPKSSPTLGSSLLTRFLSNPDHLKYITTVIYGHDHTPFNEVLPCEALLDPNLTDKEGSEAINQIQGRTIRFVCNPLGYPSHNLDHPGPISVVIPANPSQRSKVLSPAERIPVPALSA